jgi:hypothetical protein
MLNMKNRERNKPCPCGSQKKYKRCCGFAHGNPSLKTMKFSEIPDDVKKLFEMKKIEEEIRKQQQGLGKPIISADFKGYKFVAVGNRLHYSQSWKTFSDFLSPFIFSKLGTEWGNAEIKKPLEERHPIMQWYDKVCRYQQQNIKQPGQVSTMNMNGVTYCYLGLAYSLYLLNHNVELQEIYIKRLKDINNFQGAYYELLVANCLIRAGFKLELEDETDESSKHCEFSATSIKTGKKYWVEAKSRAVVGVLGKDENNGTKSKDPTGKLTDHLRSAFQKPATDERLIFVDLNCPPEAVSKPSWAERAGKILDQKEKDLKENERAYIFVTNMCFHLGLDSERDMRTLLAHGLGIPDFGKVGKYRLSEIYRQRKKHVDAHNIAESFLTYGNLPSTFDGKMASEAFADQPRDIKIGETYFFNDIGENGLVAKVTTATVNETEKKMYIGTDKGQILTMPMSEDQLSDYKKHKEYYFGTKLHQGKKTEDLYEFFDEMVRIHLEHPPESIRTKVKEFSDQERLLTLGHEDLVLEYCERLCASLPQQKPTVPQ